jgi:hypothetical protein
MEKFVFSSRASIAPLPTYSMPERSQRARYIKKQSDTFAFDLANKDIAIQISTILEPEKPIRLKK